MAEFKLTINQKDGKSVQRELKGAEAKDLLGKKIGDAVKGDDIGFAGYEFVIAGGSDHCGFPMRNDVQGTGRKRILAVSGVGLKAKTKKTKKKDRAIKRKWKGIRQRKNVCGNTIHEKISQINLKIVKEGKEKLGGEAPKEEKKEAPKAEVKKEEKKEAQKKEEAKPKEEKKEAPKEEAK